MLRILKLKKISDKASLILFVYFVIVAAGLLVSIQASLSLRVLSPSIDAAGRQRMLSQRLQFLAGQAAVDPARALTDGRRGLADFEEALAALRNGGEANGVRLSPLPRALSGRLDALEAVWWRFKPVCLAALEEPGNAAFRGRLALLDKESAALQAAAQALTADLRRLAQKRTDTAFSILLALAAAAAALFLLTYRLLWLEILRPIQELAAAAAGGGDFAGPRWRGREDELGLLAGALVDRDRANARESGQQKTTAELLVLALTAEPLDTFLGKALEAVAARPWLSKERKGAIFLTDGQPGTLRLAAQHGLPDSLKSICAVLPYGRCLCGRAAARGETVHASEVDGRHENVYAGIAPHGHYCVPMKSGGVLVGVLNLYLEHGHPYIEEEVLHLENIAGVLAGIVEKKRAEAGNAVLAEIIRQAAESVIITDTGGRITSVNEAFERVTGFSAAEAVGKKGLLKSGEHPPEFYAEMWNRLLASGSWKGRLVNRRKDGGRCVMNAIIFPLKSPAGAITAYASIQEDITQAEDQESQLRQAQKLEILGRLAGGVAHDFNNIIGAISGYATFLAPSVKGNAQAEGDLAEIGKAVEKAAGLSRQLLDFSRKRETAFRELDLKAVVCGNEKLLKTLLGGRVALELACRDAAPVKADRGQFEQVLVNLAVNARDAMPAGGKVEIKVLPHTVSTPVPTPLGVMPPGEYTVLSVRDEGQGMDEATLSKIFEPFFTTKPEGKGTGLGLSTVYGIISRHGAYLTVASSPGKGSVFTAYFPAVAPGKPAGGAV